MKDDLHFLRLWDLYSPLLTPTQQEITDLYFNYDLSLGEIAEQKGVSRQSVSDCLQKCRKQLERYEEKLGFAGMLNELSLEYSAYMTAVTKWIAERKQEVGEALDALERALDGAQKEFSGEIIEVDGGQIVGKPFRENEE